MTNAGGSILSNVEQGRVHPYQKLRPEATNIYLTMHENTNKRILGPQITPDAVDKQFTKKSMEWSTIRHSDYVQAKTNNPREIPRNRYGFDSVDDLQNTMSEGNPKSKIKKDVYNFYGMDPPPSGNPQREKLSLGELEAHQNRLREYVAQESQINHGPENPELSQGNYNERSHKGSQQHNEPNLEQNINTNFEKRENPNVEGLQYSNVQNEMVPQRVDDQPDYLQKSQP